MTKYRVVDDSQPIVATIHAQVVVAHYLEAMAHDGWELVSTCAYEDKGGIYTRYFFRRLGNLPEPDKAA